MTLLEQVQTNTQAVVAGKLDLKDAIETKGATVAKKLPTEYSSLYSFSYGKLESAGIITNFAESFGTPKYPAETPAGKKGVFTKYTIKDYNSNPVKTVTAFYWTCDSNGNQTDDTYIYFYYNSYLKGYELHAEPCLYICLYDADNQYWGFTRGYGSTIYKGECAATSGTTVYTSAYPLYSDTNCRILHNDQTTVVYDPDELPTFAALTTGVNNITNLKGETTTVTPKPTSQTVYPSTGKNAFTRVTVQAGVRSYTSLSSLESSTPDELTPSTVYQDTVTSLSASRIFSRVNFLASSSRSGTLTTGTFYFRAVDTTSPAQMVVTLTDTSATVVATTHTGAQETITYTITSTSSSSIKRFTKSSGVDSIDLGIDVQYDSSQTWNAAMSFMRAHIITYGGTYLYEEGVWKRMSEEELVVTAGTERQVFEGSYGPVIVEPVKAVTFATIEEMNAHANLAENTLAIVYGTSYVGTYKLDSGVWTQIGDSTEELEIFEDLAEVMGYADEYEGTGGTDEEINTILNDIIGGSV